MAEGFIHIQEYWRGGGLYSGGFRLLEASSVVVYLDDGVVAQIVYLLLQHVHKADGSMPCFY